MKNHNGKDLSIEDIAFKATSNGKVHEAHLPVGGKFYVGVGTTTQEALKELIDVVKEHLDRLYGNN